MSACVYPGSFDPFTNGHFDIVARASRIFNHVVILIASNSNKGNRFVPASAMKRAIEQSVAPLQCVDRKISVDILDCGTVLDYLNEHARTEPYVDYNIIRGIRDANDAVEEMRLADQYKWFTDRGFEFIPFIAKPEHRSVSSSLVREMFKYGRLDKLPVPNSVYNLIVSKEA